jgi:hypothetical protein
VIHEDMVSDADRDRLRAEQDARRDMRPRARCARGRCRRKIPESRRLDAIYCSRKCATAASGERKYALVRYIATRVRAESVRAARCEECGKEIPPSSAVARGPIPRWCPGPGRRPSRCYMRGYMRRRRATQGREWA